MRLLFLFLTLVVACVDTCGEEPFDPFVHLSGYARGVDNRELKFSNTRKWDPKYLAYTQKKAKFLPPDWRSNLAAEIPPGNDSLRTRAELDYLLKLQKKRTPDDVQRINREITLAGFQFGKWKYPEFKHQQKKPRTFRLAEAVNHDIGVVMMQAKHHFDRVRPSDLEPRIKPSIEIPGHPAYPSGHSTQAHAWAYLIVELVQDESQHEAILAGARLIARDRELAGVHYPSDSALGQRIARQVVDMWMANPEFVALLEAARPEWQE